MWSLRVIWRGFGGIFVFGVVIGEGIVEDFHEECFHRG